MRRPSGWLLGALVALVAGGMIGATASCQWSQESPSDAGDGGPDAGGNPDAGGGPDAGVGPDAGQPGGGGPGAPCGDGGACDEGLECRSLAGGPPTCQAIGCKWVDEPCTRASDCCLGSSCLNQEFTSCTPDAGSQCLCKLYIP